MPIVFKRKYSSIRNYSSLPNFNNYPDLIEFSTRFENNMINSKDNNTDYKIYDTSEFFIINQNNRNYVVIVDSHIIRMW